MKPLELEIQGLYSYREKERLDFRPFHRVRLFGIFGKTGDGKSSILDAMTFALYGRLDRLGRNLREAVNPASGHLLVNFSFELDGEVFRVNRLFDPRSGTKAVLYRQEGGRWLPLAERTREVEDQLERILGLRFEEFTKVVILPQGKFAEFLRLTPARRAEM
ncbi:MAG: AAA family ATPase, partial [Thermodesulfobacteria bacterium]|nr:AAA family ATPase [Thermodesulfobacteriota bacterium]